ncbi:MAG: hypothetical protein HY054_01700 [Proteobacteria bacterium]|nr:hypothetical protein [Pseudomonadota bacterium]
MFGFAIDLHDLREHFDSVIAAQARTWMGAAFVAAAMFSIQYEEVLAPHVERISNAWNATTADISRRISGVSL